ncbi:uncharacterized protein LOC122813039 [Protopterus annectens]|uniref:uncharacterized protein LOC122813039 n=1 Tax=Protopterus annectens TaxID=7888 RepID=UPI001CF9FF61|nr:uncharacterized protein LOC122813039 [Protopterus annectens]
MFPCCCKCFTKTSADAERQPLSARTIGPYSKAAYGTDSLETARDTTVKKGKVNAKLVGVPDIDHLFTDIGDTFNKQHQHCLEISEYIRQVNESYKCPPNSSFSVCLQKIKEKHRDLEINVQMQGYSFMLEVQPEGAHEKLLHTQQQIKNLSLATKSVLAAGTTLQEMINYVLQKEEELTDRVKKMDLAYQDKVRVESNLKENLQEVRRTKQLSVQYRETANQVLAEMAQLADITI